MITSQQVHEFIRQRRSVRRFTEERIERATLDRILETAIHAPSAHNRQPWRFAILTSVRDKMKLAESMAVEFARDLDADGLAPRDRDVALERSRSRIASAPAAILLCMDPGEMDQYSDERRAEAEHIMAVQSVSNAGTLLLLAAHAEGLGGVWICAPLFAPASVAAALQLPASWEPQALLLIGRPAVTPPARPRRSLEQVAIYK